MVTRSGWRRGVLVLALICAGAVAQTAAAAPANDSFASRQKIFGACGSVTGSNVGATREPNEPFHAFNKGGASVWYAWTAPATRSYTFDTFGSNFDTLLAVYRGEKIGSLTPIAANDNALGATQSALSFNATAGVSYSIAVDGRNGGFSPATGSITLNWRDTNNSFACAARVPGPCGRTTGSNLGATAELGEPGHAGRPAVDSIWYRWAAPVSDRVSITTFGSSYGTRIAVYTGSDVARLSPLIDPFTGLRVASDNADGSSNARVTFFASAGTTYQIAVDSDVKEGDIRLHWALPRYYDPFDCAEVLAGTPGTVFGSNVRATAEPGEPDDGGLSGASSIWYDWTAPATGEYSFDTAESRTPSGACLDTILTVWTGATISTLGRVTANDDAPLACQLWSKLSFDATAGTTYRISVGGYNPGANQGSVRLSWRLESYWPPPPGAGVNHPADGSARVGEVQRFVTTCSDERGWHDIATIDLRLARGQGHGRGEPVALWVQFDEKRGVMRLYDPDADTWSEGVPGSSTVLANRYAELRLAGSSVAGSGPTGPTVTLTWEVVFKRPAAGRNWQQFLRTVDDLGGTVGFERVGSFDVLG